MSPEHALQIRADQLAGKPVRPYEFKDALETIHRYRHRPKGGRPPKFRLPILRQMDRERMNAILIYRLGVAMGRIEERKAA
jgi:hypothetical protein